MVKEVEEWSRSGYGRVAYVEMFATNALPEVPGAWVFVGRQRVVGL